MQNDKEQNQAQEPEQNQFLAKVKAGDAIVADLKEKYGDTQAVAKDEKGLNEAIKVVAKARSGVENSRKEIVSAIVSVQKAVNKEADRIKDEIQAIELPLLAARKKILDDRQAEEEKIKAAEMRLFTDRTTSLFEAGYTFDGANYVVGLAFVPAAEITTMDQAAYEKHLENGREEAERIRRLLEHASKAVIAPSIDDVIDPEFEESDPYGVWKAQAESDGDGNGETAWAGGSTHETKFVQSVPLTRPAESDLPFGDPNETPTDPSQLDHELVRIYGKGDAPEGYRPQGYSMGFEACRNMVLEILADPTPISRGDLKKKIKELIM